MEKKGVSIKLFRQIREYLQNLSDVGALEAELAISGLSRHPLFSLPQPSLSLCANSAAATAAASWTIETIAMLVTRRSLVMPRDDGFEEDIDDECSLLDVFSRLYRFKKHPFLELNYFDVVKEIATDYLIFTYQDNFFDLVEALEQHLIREDLDENLTFFRCHAFISPYKYLDSSSPLPVSTSNIILSNSISSDYDDNYSFSCGSIHQQKYTSRGFDQNLTKNDDYSVSVYNSAWYMQLHNVIKATQRSVVFFSSWHSSSAIFRTWCLLEMFISISVRPSDGFFLAMTKRERLRFDQHMLDEDAIDTVESQLLKQVNILSSRCRMEVDSQMICQELDCDDVGWGVVDIAICDKLLDWVNACVRSNYEKKQQERQLQLSQRQSNDSTGEEKSFSISDEANLNKTVESLKGQLGCLYHLQGDVSLAQGLIEDFLMKLAENPGLKLPRLKLRAVTSLVSLFQESGLLTKARALMETCLRECRNIFGEKHPYTLECMTDLAIFYRATGNLLNARPLVEDVLRKRRDILPKDHIDVLRAISNVAEVYQMTNDFHRAKSLFEECLRIRKTSLGSEHRDTLTSLHSLGCLLYCSGDLPAARSLMEECVRLRTKVLGSTHEDTLASMASLSRLHFKGGDITAAKAILEPCYHTRRSKLGAFHEETINCMRRLGRIYGSEGRLDVARDMLAKLVSINRLVKGEANADTQASIEELSIVIALTNGSGGRR